MKVFPENPNKLESSQWRLCDLRLENLDINLARSDENRKATLSYQFVLYDSYKILPNYKIWIKSYKNRTIRIDVIS